MHNKDIFDHNAATEELKQYFKNAISIQKKADTVGVYIVTVRHCDAITDTAGFILSSVMYGEINTSKNTSQTMPVLIGELSARCSRFIKK